MIEALAKHNLGVRATALLVACIVGSLGADNVAAQQKQSSLEGSWRGGGRVVFPSGDAERATCRASFSRRTANSFRMSAVCATASARVAQSATLERISGNTYAGSFFNPEYNFSGDITVTVRGDRLSAQLRGGGGGANLNLGR
jgi:hypothetical protein